jgi:hypothetical protein
VAGSTKGGRVYQQKQSIRILILTDGFRVEGDLHILAGSRLTDALNSHNKDFFPITNAKIFRVGSEELLHRADYVAVNRAGIDCIMEVPVS